MDFLCQGLDIVNSYSNIRASSEATLKEKTTKKAAIVEQTLIQ